MLAHEKWALVEVLDDNVVGAGTSWQRMPDVTSRVVVLACFLFSGQCASASD